MVVRCISLKDFIIPSSVTTIEDEAFGECKELTTITIPKGVLKIGTMLFSGCDNLKSIIVEDGNPIYDSRENCNAIIETNKNILISGCANSKIPTSVVAIGEYAFYQQKSLTSITIPASITNIGKQAFSGCTGVTNISSYIPASNVPDIEVSVFYLIDRNKCTLYIPHGTTGTYRSKNIWKTFNNIIEM